MDEDVLMILYKVLSILKSHANIFEDLKTPHFQAPQYRGILPMHFWRIFKVYYFTAGDVFRELCDLKEKMKRFIPSKHKHKFSYTFFLTNEDEICILS